jgi:hypothetical protein
MAIYPMGILDRPMKLTKIFMDKSLRWLEKKGTMACVVISFSWARLPVCPAKEGDTCSKNARILPCNFVSNQ